MNKRSFLLALGLAALLSMAFVPASQAGMVLVTTTVDFHVDGGGTASDVEITYNPSGLAIDNLMYTSTDGLTGAAISPSGSMVTLTFDPSASATGVVFTFETDASAADVGVFSYQLTGLAGTVHGSGVNVAIEVSGVPEPASVALLGIGMTGFLVFRRFRKRLSVG